MMDDNFVLTADWRVLWNPKLYDVDARYEEGLNNVIKINNSRGRAIMRDLPQVGETVIVVWAGYARMIGQIIQGFTEGMDHQTDPRNKGEYRPHAEPPCFAVLELRSIRTPTPVPFMGQRTWVRFNRD